MLRVVWEGTCTEKYNKRARFISWKRHQSVCNGYEDSSSGDEFAIQGDRTAPLSFQPDSPLFAERSARITADAIAVSNGYDDLPHGDECAI